MLLRLIVVCASLCLGNAQLASADNPFTPGDLGRGLIAPDATRLGAGDFIGDAREDLIVQREADDGRFIELWERVDGTESGYRLGPDLGLRAAVIDTLVFDVDFDGDRDLVVATADPNDTVALWLNEPAQTPRLRRAPQRFALDGIRRIRRFFLENSLGAIVALRGPGQAVRVLGWNGSDGLALLAQEFPHPGGAFDAVPIYYGDYSEPPALLSLGAPPQHLWRWTAGGYVESALNGISSDVRLAAPLDFGRDGDQLITADDEGKVETWQATAPAVPDGPPGDYEFRNTLTAGSEDEIVLLDTLRLATAPIYHLLVGRRMAITGEVLTWVFELNQAVPGQTSVGAFDGGSAKVESEDVVLLGSLDAGLRSWVLGGVVPTPPALAVSFSPANPHGYFAVEGMPTTVDFALVATAKPATGFSVPLISSLGIPAANFVPGASRTSTSTYVSGLPVGTTTTITLDAPSDAAVTLQAPTQSTLTVKAIPTQQPSPSFCPAICLMRDLCLASGTRNGAIKTSAPTMGTDAEIQTLRDFRDDVLDTSPTGREYIALYEQFSYEFARATFADPTFFGTLWDAKDAWMPAVESVTHGDGSAVIDAPMIEAMDEVFEHFRSRGSRELRQAIGEHYARLQPGDFEGQSIGALAQHWADLPPLPIFDSGFESP